MIVSNVTISDVTISAWGEAGPAIPGPESVRGLASSATGFAASTTCISSVHKLIDAGSSTCQQHGQSQR